MSLYVMASFYPLLMVLLSRKRKCSAVRKMMFIVVTRLFFVVTSPWPHCFFDHSKLLKSHSIMNPICFNFKFILMKKKRCVTRYIKPTVYSASCSIHFLYNKRAEEAALGAVNDNKDDTSSHRILEVSSIQRSPTPVPPCCPHDVDLNVSKATYLDPKPSIQSFYMNKEPFHHSLSPCYIPSSSLSFTRSFHGVNRQRTDTVKVKAALRKGTFAHEW